MKNITKHKRHIKNKDTITEVANKIAEDEIKQKKKNRVIKEIREHIRNLYIQKDKTKA